MDFAKWKVWFEMNMQWKVNEWSDVAIFLAVFKNKLLVAWKSDFLNVEWNSLKAN